MSCSHIYGSDRSRKLSCRHFRGFMLLKDLKKLKGRERVTPDKAFFVLYPAWRQLESDGGVKPDCIPGEGQQDRPPPPAHRPPPPPGHRHVEHLRVDMDELAVSP